jgi:hypothetical protein
MDQTASSKKWKRKSSQGGKMSKHTPGPWEVEHYDPACVVMKNQVAIVAPGPDGASYEEQKANAALIAAAPDMLMAIKRTRDFLAENLPGTGKPGTFSTNLDDLLAEVEAKAEGKK